MRLPTFFLREKGGLRDASGKLIAYDLERFVAEVCLGGHCFICGVSRDDAVFNDEHIIPRWVLDYADQFNGILDLPNETAFKGYGRYKIPCCKQCNTELGAVFEEVLAPAVRGGYKAFAKYLRENGPLQAFRWLALLYLKTHLRDARLRSNRDARSGDNSTVGDIYEWHVLHHVHCIARSHYTGIEFKTPDIGSMMIVPAEVIPGQPIFDYADLYMGRAIMIRIGEIAMFAVLNDASIVFDSFPRAQQVLMDRKGKPLNPFQIRELYAGFAWRNMCLLTRPEFSTVVVPRPHFYVEYPDSIRFDGPPPQMPNRPSYGGLLHALCRSYLKTVPPEKRPEVEKDMQSGTLTFFSTHVPWWPDSKPPKKARRGGAIRKSKPKLRQLVKEKRSQSPQSSKAKNASNSAGQKRKRPHVKRATTK